MAIDTRALTTCSLGVLISGSINDDYIQGSGLIKTTGSVELDGIVVPEIGTAVTFSYTRNGQTYNIPRKLRVLSSFADPFRRVTQVQLGCKLTYLQDLTEPLKWRPQDDPLNSNTTAEDEEIITVPIFASSVMNRCLRKLGITTSLNPLTNIFSIGEFDYSNGYVNILSDLLLSESYCGYLDAQEILQIIDLRQSGGTGPLLQAQDFVDIGSINSGELPGEAIIVNFSSLKLKNSENGAIQTEDKKLAEIDPLLRSFVSWDRSENASIELISLEYTQYNDQNSKVKYYNTIDYTEEVSTYKELITYKDVLVKKEDQENQVDLPSEMQRQVDEVKRLVDKRITTSTKDLVKVAPKCVSELLKFYVETGNDLIQEVTIDTYFYDVNGEKVFEISETTSSLIAAYAALDVPYVFENDASTGDDILTRSFTSYARITGPDDSVTFEEFIITFSFINPYTTQTFTSSKRTVETVKIGNVTKNITTEYVPFYSTAVGQQVTSKQKDSIKTAAQAIDYVKRMTVLTKSKTSISITGEEAPVQEAPRKSDIVNARNVEKNNQQGTPDPDNGWRAESSSESVLAIGSFAAQRRKDFSLPYAPDDYFQVGILPGGQKTYSSAPSGAAAKARLFGRIQNKLLLGNRSGLNIQALPEKIPNIPFAPFVVQANGLSALYRSNGYNWTLDASGVIASVDALFWGGVGGTGEFWFPVAPGIVELPETPPVIDGQITVDTVTPVWNEKVLLFAATSSKAVVSSYPYALSNTRTVLATTRTLIEIIDPFVIDPALIVYSQSSIYSENTAASIAGMQNGEFEEVSETGTDNDAQAWIQMAFGATKKVRTIVIGCDFTSVLPGGWGPEYTENCDVEASFDGENWTLLFNTGTFTQGIQEYTVNTFANYIRITRSGYIAITEFYALSIGGVEIGIPPIDVNISSLTPKSTGKEKIEITGPSIDINTSLNAPIISTGATVDMVDITIETTCLIPELVGNQETKVFAQTVDIVCSIPSPSVRSSLAISMPSEDIPITAVVPTQIGAETDPYFSNVSTLLHMDGANNSTSFVDSTPNSLTIATTGDVKIRSTQSKFGGTSAYFDGTGDSLLVSALTLFSISGNFTAECWFYPTSYAASNNVLFNIWYSSGNKLVVATLGTSGNLVYLLNGGLYINTGITPTINAWSHLALVRLGSTTTLYLNGTSVGTTTATPSSGQTLFEIGTDRGGAYYSGYIDEVRFTNGVARYVSNFTPPIASFPNN